MVPRILRQGLLQIGPVPPVDAEWPLAERREALLRARIAPDVEPVGVERRPEQLDLGPRGADLRLLLLADEARSDERHQEPDDHHHDHHLDEREARLSPACTHGRTPHIGRSLTLKIADSMEMTMKPMPSPMTRISTGSSRRVN